MKKYIFIALLTAASCTKSAELVHLSLSNVGGRFFYSFTYQGGMYSPQDSTVVVTSQQAVTLPANEPSGYMGATSGDVKIISATNKLIKLSF